MLSALTKLRRGRPAMAALVAALALSALAPHARGDDSAAPKPVAAASEQGMLVGVGLVIVGVIASIFTGVMVTRVMFDFWVRNLDRTAKLDVG
jgi:hypothetical protein